MREKAFLLLLWIYLIATRTCSLHEEFRIAIMLHRIEDKALGMPKNMLNIFADPVNKTPADTPKHSDTAVKQEEGGNRFGEIPVLAAEIYNFIRQLRQDAEACESGAVKDPELRDKIQVNVSDGKPTKRLLENPS